jgi:hypothetical protein
VKKIIVTCDTEISDLAQFVDQPFEIFIEGRLSGSKELGVKLINRLSEQHGAPVTHFVDVYGSYICGEEKFAELCTNLISRGHSIGLHTHPMHAFDSSRRRMMEYSLKEQVDILKFGKQKLKEWTGIDVKIHRGGSYGINPATMEALRSNGLTIDCSALSNKNGSPLPGGTFNAPFIFKQVLEIPVTVYDRVSTLKGLGLKRSTITKLDLKYGSSVQDIIRVVDQAPENSVMVIFLHSFNFINRYFDSKRKRFVRFEENTELIQDYEKLLSVLSKTEDCTFASVDNSLGNQDLKDFLIRVEREILPKEYAVKRFWNAFRTVKNV